VIDQELCKVPANIGSAIVGGELSLQERIKLPGLRAVDVPLLEPREFIFRSEFALHEFQNLLFGTRLLSPKLVAREGKYLESPRAVQIVQFTELDIVHIRQTSFGGYVDDAKDISPELVHLDVIAIDVTVNDVVEGIRVGAAVLPEQQLRTPVLQSC